MNLKFWNFSLILLLLTGCQTEKKEDTSFHPPNIIWLVAEDMSPYLPVYGDSTVVTPHLSQLAKEGETYQHVYSTSGVCSPSRYSLITGRYHNSDGAQNHRTLGGKAYMEEIGLVPYEVVPPAGVRMFSEILRENGYYCTNNSKTDYQFRQTATGWDESSLSAHWRNRAKDQPFFSIFNFAITHESQFFNPQSNFKMNYLMESFPDYDQEQNWGAPYSEQMQLLPDSIDNFPIPPYLPTTEIVVEDFKTMYNNLLILDRQIGVIIDQLKADGLYDDSIIVFYGDHGGALPRQKRSLKDSGLRVPMIIKWPQGERANTTNDQMISFVDFGPTMLSLAGIKPHDFFQGKPFGGKYQTQPNEYIYAASGRFDEKYDMVRAVRDQRYKYIKNYLPDLPYDLNLSYRNKIPTMQELLRLKKEGKLNDQQAQWMAEQRAPEELYDTQNDPFELNNLADQEKYRPTLEALRKQCEDWMKKINDKGDIAEKDLLAAFWPNLQQPITQQPKITKADNITITSNEKGVTIGFQMLKAGEAVRDNWKIYTEPIADVNNDVVKIVAVADRIGWQKSEVVAMDLGEE
ncbi:MAG: sulfatase [Bacteroidota bacterium]